MITVHAMAELRLALACGVAPCSPVAPMIRTRQRTLRPIFFVAFALGCALAAGCATAADPISIADAQTGVRVKTALVNDEIVGGHAIEVRVSSGVVTLSGRVRTQAEADRAVALARAVEGVSDVRSDLRIGVDAPDTAEAPVGPTRLEDVSELDANPTLFAVGGALGWTVPRADTLESRVTVSPFVKLGSGEGLGPAIGFDWFQTDLQSDDTSQSVTLGRVRVKPVMFGLAYGMGSGRVSVSPSVVGGVAFNRLAVTGASATGSLLPVDVGHSLAWRAAVSVWVDMSRRTALNFSAGHILTRLRITALDEGRLRKYTTSGDTTVAHVGLAYRLF